VANEKNRSELAWWLFVFLWFGCWHLWHTWSVWMDPVNRVPGPIGDNMVMLWNLGWVKHALDHGSTGFWFTNAYYPEGFLFLFSTHTWLDGVLGWLFSSFIPDGYQGSILWANITMFSATVMSGVLVIAGLQVWNIRSWPLLILISSAVTFSWFRMFALTGHYHFYGTHWMLAALVIASLGRRSYSSVNNGKAYFYFILSGMLTGLAFLNDQTMAVFASILSGLIILATGNGSYRERFIRQARFAGCLYGSALIIASIHLIPISLAITEGKLKYNLGTTGQRLVDASSLILPPDYHLLGPGLTSYRTYHGLKWAEGTYLGIVPMVLLVLGALGSVQFLLEYKPRSGNLRQKANGAKGIFDPRVGDMPDLNLSLAEISMKHNRPRVADLSQHCLQRACFLSMLAAWGFIVLALGDTLVIGHDSFVALPGRLLEFIPVLNNIRLPQRWIWPAQLCIALGGASALSYYIRRWPTKQFRWGLLVLAIVPPMEGKMMLPPVDFHNDSFVRPAGLVKAVSNSYTDGSVLVMPVEAAYAHGNVLQFQWGYDIPLTVVYTARMPFSIKSLPWSGNQWTPETGPWLQNKEVTIIVFPFHNGNLADYKPWLRKANEAVPDLKVLDQSGNLVQIATD